MAVMNHILKPHRFVNLRPAVLFLGLAFLTACGDKAPPVETSEDAPAPARTTFVQLFEWKWPDIARECENFLGPAGYGAVQVSPPNEHVQGSEWWTRYQPVSYKLESRGGTREEFADMVQRCRKAGVDIYGDAIVNHMSYAGTGTGVAGSEFSEYTYTVPYSFEDFHHCGRYDDDVIRNYQDRWEIQNCELSKLTDLDTGKPEVQEKIAAYLNDLLDLGVAGFRIDAAKHMSPEDIAGIVQRLDGEPHIYQEVIDRGGEPIKGSDYIGNGLVSEFKFGMAVFDAFDGRELSGISDLASREGFLPSEKAVVFIDNHDIQRGHAGASHVLTYKNGRLYELANVFMLAWPYGNPMVMSSYRFENGDQGPPSSHPIDAGSGECDDAWVCEHRLPAIAGMVGFRNATDGAAVTYWQVLSDSAIAFGRGDQGFVVINVGDTPIAATVSTGLPPGSYCNVVAGCGNRSHDIEADGSLQVSLPSLGALAIHTGAPARH
jgi:alpha-amylase